MPLTLHRLLPLRSSLNNSTQTLCMEHANTLMHANTTSKLAAVTCCITADARLALDQPFWLFLSWTHLFSLFHANLHPRRGR